MRLTALLILLLIFSCGNESDQTTHVSKTEQEWSSNHSVDFNQEIHVREEIDITMYLEHHKDLKMKLNSVSLKISNS